MSEFDAEVTVRRTRYVSDSTGWAVVEAAAGDGLPLVLVGPLNHLEERERAHIIGTWVNDKRFGPQVKVAEARPLPPSDADALAAYLVRIKHVGPKRAASLIGRYGAASILEQIDRDPEAAFAAAGLRRRALEQAIASWESLRVTRRLHMLLAPFGLAYLVKRIHDHYGDGAHRVVSRSPYELTSVFGVGFQLADRIARGVGIPPDSPERARAGVLHLLADAERGGSTCQSIEVLLASLARLLGPDQRLSRSLVNELVSSGEVEVEGEWVYRAETARLEAELAERVAGLLQAEPSGSLRQLGSAPVTAGDEPTAEQLTGVQNAFAHSLSLITGGPGTGKTASIRAIGTVAERRRAKLMLVAPTGRAAIRMSEATGLRAQTVHAALGWIPGEGPTHDEDHPLRCDVLIVDESSMANLELLVTLLRAVSNGTNVVLVGDADQLAPVGAGKPFAELVSSGLVPTARLTHIFRQAAGSMIVQGAHAIRRGLPPDFGARDGMRRDLFLVERSDPVAAREEIVSLVSRRLPAHYGIDPVREIQVFAPVYRGELGIDRLNEALRDALNPDGATVGGGRLRIGDKLMLTGRNLHELGLMNGTLLRLLDEIVVDPGDGEDRGSLLLSAEDAVFRLPPEDVERLQLAYACSVHRGQGVELPVAVVVAHPAAGAFFLRREMLYTAVTRAKLATVIVGSREVVARAAARPDTGSRHSRLVERLQQ
jgi:exodeoxyribonuclease V alpha subunit